MLARCIRRLADPVATAATQAAREKLLRAVRGGRRIPLMSKRVARSKAGRAPSPFKARREEFLLARHAAATQRQRKLGAARRSSGLAMHNDPEFNRSFCFLPADIEEKSTKGTGPGGQATNRRKQTCILWHRPTGTVVKSHHFPSLYANRKAARLLLHLRLERAALGADSDVAVAARLREARARRKALRDARLSRRALRRARAAAAQDPLEEVMFGGGVVPPRPGADGFAVAIGAVECSPGGGAAAACGANWPPLSAQGPPLVLGRLHDDLCAQWGAALDAAYEAADDAGLAPGAVAGGAEGETDAARWALQVAPPLLFRCAFPVAGPHRPLPRGEASWAVRVPALAAAEAASARESVRRSFMLLVEAFGLHLAPVAGGWQLRPDGLNWIESRHRLRRPAAAVVLMRAAESLRQLELAPEREALAAFMAKETAAGCDVCAAVAGALARLADRRVPCVLPKRRAAPQVAPMAKPAQAATGGGGGRTA